jgi:hypothetical protein
MYRQPEWQDVVSLNEVSPNISTGIIIPRILRPKIIAVRCVPILGGGGASYVVIGRVGTVDWKRSIYVRLGERSLNFPK